MKSEHQDKLICGFGIGVFDYEETPKIKDTIASLRGINYPKNGYKIILSSKHKEQASELFNYVNEFKHKSILAELIISLDDNVNIEKDVYSKCIQATHLVKIKAGDELNPDLFDMINKINSKELNKYTCFEYKETKIINFYTVNELYLNFNSFDLLFESIKNTSEYKNLNEK